MNSCVLFAIVLCAVAATTSARSLAGRNGMVYYHASPVYYSARQQAAPVAHRMYLQYGQALKSNRRSNYEEGGVSAYAAGNTVAAGTYLGENEGEADEPQVQLDGGAQSVAEAYPEAYPQNDEAADDGGALADDAGQFADQPASFAPSGPVADVPQRKKKVRVEADAENDEEDDGFAAFNPNQKGKPSRAGNGGGVPSNTFFPVHFGSTAGGAIAVANSFSTGKGGTATSHATAYGSPAAKAAALKSAQLRRRQ